MPTELALSVMSFVDAETRARAASVSRAWQGLADDEAGWGALLHADFGPHGAHAARAKEAYQNARVFLRSLANSRCAEVLRPRRVTS